MTQPALPQSHNTPGRPMAPWEWLLLAGALLIFFLLADRASLQKSASFDEQYHLAAGYAYLRTGDFRLADNHPPLMGLLGGLGLLTKPAVALPLDRPAWAGGDRYLFSDNFLWEANADAPALLAAARRPIILVGMGLLLVLFFATRQMLGVAPGWLALGLAGFDPNLLANSRVVTTDLGVTTLLFTAVWLLWRWLERPTLPALLLTGLAAGLAMGAKYTGLLFWPIAAVIVLLYPPATDGSATIAWWRRPAGVATMGLVALVTLWALFRFTWQPVTALPIAWPLPTGFYWDKLWQTLSGIVAAGDEKMNFLLGRRSVEGWWYYLPVALAVKTPLPTLLLSGAGLLLMIRRGQWRRQAVLWVPPLAFLLLGMTGLLTIGYRHLLPMLPFLMAAAGNVVAALPAGAPVGRRRVQAAAVGLMLVWLMVSSLRIFPHHDAYFNEAAGPWTNWSTILVDSNLDWGQDLPALAALLDRRGIERVNLAYFGKAVPEAYGVRYHPLPSYLRFVDGPELSAYNPHTPEPGWYAISATSLRLGMTTPESVDLYAFFRDLTPVDRAGYSIYLYRVDYPESMPVDRIPVIGSDVARLSMDELGQRAGRRGQIKWMQSPRTLIYGLGNGYTPPAALVETPGDFDGVLRLRGYVVTDDAGAATAQVAPGQSVMVTLVWEVGNRPMPMPAPTQGRPLSAFVHLTQDDPGRIVAQYDGWETALRGLEPGDIIVQQAGLNVPADLAPGSYPLRAGLYSPQSMQRLPVESPDGRSDHLVLGAIRVAAPAP